LSPTWKAEAGRSTEYPPGYIIQQEFPISQPVAEERHSATFTPFTATRTSSSALMHSRNRPSRTWFGERFKVRVTRMLRAGLVTQG